MGQTSLGCAAEFGEGKNIIDVRHQHRYFTWNGIIGKEFLHHVFDGLGGSDEWRGQRILWKSPGAYFHRLAVFSPSGRIQELGKRGTPII